MSISLKDRAYSHIRTKLISGEFSPGSQLSHRALAKEIGVSFTPVREALSQLASEGLVESKPRMGTFVSRCSREELIELYDLREALEGHAVMKAAENISESDLNEMQRFNDVQLAIIQEMKTAEAVGWTTEQIDCFATADASLHIVLLRAAGNRRTLRLISDLHVMTHIFGHRNLRAEFDVLTNTVREHQEIIDALRRKSPEDARKAVIAGLRSGCRQALIQYDRVRLEEATGQIASVSYPSDLRERLAQMEDSIRPTETE